MKKIKSIRLDSLLLEGDEVKYAQGIAKGNMNNDVLFVRLVIDSYLTSDASIIVPETHKALLIKNGEIVRVLEKGLHYIKDKNTFFDLFKSVDSINYVEVIYVSTTLREIVPFGTPESLSIKDRNTRLNVEFGVSGEYEITVSDPSKFYLNIVGLDKVYNKIELQQRLLRRVLLEFKPALISFIEDHQLSITQHDLYLKEFSSSFTPHINTVLEDEFGIHVLFFYLNKIVLKDQRLAEMSAYCPHCGKVIVKGNQFCPYCGKEIK